MTNVLHPASHRRLIVRVVQGIHLVVPFPLCPISQEGCDDQHSPTCLQQALRQGTRLITVPIRVSNQRRRHLTLGTTRKKKRRAHPRPMQPTRPKIRSSAT